MVIERQPVNDLVHCIALRGEGLFVQPTPQALSWRIVPAVALAAHRRLNAVALERVLELAAAALVEFTQYASALHQALLARHGLVGSMSRKGNCWDNAVIELFFLSLKTKRVWQRDHANHANHAEAMTDIADYIVGYYNSVRLHSKLGNLPPNDFEKKSAIK